MKSPSLGWWSFHQYGFQDLWPLGGDLASAGLQSSELASQSSWFALPMTCLKKTPPHMGEGVHQL